MIFEQLTANRYKLSRAIERKLEGYKAAAQTKIFNKFLSPKFATPLVVSKEAQFQFPPDAYPAGSLYKGSHKFKKHYFPVITPQEKKVLALEVFGSNLVLDCKKARGSCVKPWSLLVENTSTGGVVPTTGLEPV